MRIDTDSFQPDIDFQSNLPSYGLAINARGKMFSTTAWLGENSVNRFDSERGFLEQRWRVEGMNGDVYGISTDLDGNLWGTIWPSNKVLQIQGDYQCPNRRIDCTITEGDGILKLINVEPALRRLGAVGEIHGRGLAVDVNGFVWAVFNTTGNGVGIDLSPSFLVKIDGLTGDVIQAVEVGLNAVGITPDADGFIWTVNYAGGGANFQNFACPNGVDPSSGGTVTKVRSSDGAIVGTYPTCGMGPYTYSDMAGYALRSVTLRSGRWRALHDSGRLGLSWGRINWRSDDYADTTLEMRVRAADTREDLANQNYQVFTNGADLPLLGRFIEVEAYFFTRNDFLGPVLRDLTVSSVCQPEPELCNGLDDDCNNLVDDGNPGGGQACTTGLEGLCAQGQTFCNNGEFECRPTRDPVNELCDGLDNNCNGRIDEGVTNLCGTCGPAPVEVCDGDDNDCDGGTDEGVTNACGACGAVPAEVCDGDDNDCDGLTDEGLLNECGECGPTPTEACDGEDNDCDGLIDEGLLNACGECGPAPTERCNGLDDDCDGATDEGLLNACGACGPTPVEVCDGDDNDCDGMIDENVLNECGACGRVPDEACNGFDDDCDGQTDEGVTNRCGGCGVEPTEVCNGIDDDCDGQTDEDVKNACGGCGLVDPEVCDGQDNDCDGQTDEGVTNACGACGPLSPDVCDGQDNDCDGELDEEPACEGNQGCVDGQCADACTAGECPRGYYCQENFCVLDRCLGLRCSEGQVCQQGTCIDQNSLACQDVTCAVGEVCLQGACQDDPCRQLECPQGQACWLGECLPAEEAACRPVSCGVGQVCDNGACVADPCLEVRCEKGQACVEGACQDACLQIQCNVGFNCTQGVCVEDRCFNVACEANQVCQDGNCISQSCIDVACPDGQFCGPNGCQDPRACGDDLCEADEVCVEGVCQDINGADEVPDDEPAAKKDEGCGCSTPHKPTRWPWASLPLLVGAAVLLRSRRQAR
jgi:MYXO-CTERM domain-containing protein